jgi:signal transduction histidine kinase
LNESSRRNVADGVGRRGRGPCSGSAGLRGLADRIAALDGTLPLDSPPGEGTRLHAEIPLSRRA